MSSEQFEFLASLRCFVHFIQKCFRIEFEVNPIAPDTQNLNFVFGFPPITPQGPHVYFVFLADSSNAKHQVRRMS